MFITLSKILEYFVEGKHRNIMTLSYDEWRRMLPIGQFDDWCGREPEHRYADQSARWWVLFITKTSYDEWRTTKMVAWSRTKIFQNDECFLWRKHRMTSDEDDEDSSYLCSLITNLGIQDKDFVNQSPWWSTLSITEALYDEWRGMFSI